MCGHICSLTQMHACKNVQASLHVNCASCQTHTLELIANNGCQLGSRCKQYKWVQVYSF